MHCPVTPEDVGHVSLRAKEESFAFSLMLSTGPERASISSKEHHGDCFILFLERATGQRKPRLALSAVSVKFIPL